MGKIALVKGIDISATAGITIVSNVQNLSNISNFKMSYSSTKFDKISLNTSSSAISMTHIALCFYIAMLCGYPIPSDGYINGSFFFCD